MPASVPIQLLQSFLTFAEAKNIVAAARALGVTQPALSKQLRQLEMLMPGKLFTMQGRKKVLTPFGRDLCHRVRPRFAGLGDLVGEAWAVHASAENARLRIVGRRGVLDRISGKLLFPGSLHFAELDNDATLTAVTEGRAEIGIVHQVPPRAQGLVARPLFEEGFQLVVPKPLLPERAALGRELFQRLGGLPCLGYKTADEVLHSVCGFFGINYRELRLLRATESYLSLAEMANAGIGWAVLPDYLPISKTSWVWPLPAKALPPRKFYLVYRPEFAAIPWFKDLATELRGCFG